MESTVIRQQLQSFWITLRTYWERPRKNEYVNYREVAGFSIGAMGVKGVNSMLGFIQLAPTCLLIASVYGLSPRDIMILFAITNIISIIKTPFVSMLVDNTNTKIGKFRPYLLWAGVPTVLSIIALTWFIPLNASSTVKIILIGIFFNILSISQPLYNNAYMGISQVITPNSQERTNILSISEFLGNLGPSITALVVPSLAGIFFGKDGMLDIRAYRILLPAFSIIGFAMGLIVLYYSKERVIKPKDEKEKISFIEGIKQISKNRYFWIVTISKFFDGFKGGLSMMLTWVCAYQLQNTGIQGIVSTIVSVGYTPGIILAPFFIKKMGSKRAALLFHFLNPLAALVMLMTFKNGFVFFVISLFLYNFALGPQYIMQTSMLSDGFDYQQDKQGIRIEGFAQNFMLMITTIGTIISTSVFTFIYESNGLIADAVTGLTDYSILINDNIREPIITGVILVVIITSLFSALPYFFCNLTSKDMENIRLSLEKKKFIHENNLSNASKDEQDEAFEKFEKLIAEEEAILAEKLEKEKETTKLQIEEYAKIDKQEIKKLRQKEKEQLSKQRKELKERKKVFIDKEIKRAKANGEKGYLRIIAREKFEDMLIEEQSKTQ